MKRKALWLSGLALAALLTLSPDADAGGRVWLRTGPLPRRHVVFVAHPGSIRFAGYRGWDRARHAWLPGGWIARRPEFVGRDGRWWHGHDGRSYRRGYRRPW